MFGGFLSYIRKYTRKYKLLYATNVHNDFLGPPGIDPDLIDAQGFIQEAIGSFLFILFIQI